MFSLFILFIGFLIVVFGGSEANGFIFSFGLFVMLLGFLSAGIS